MNEINPTCYMISKVQDMVPVGIIKFTMKLDDYNPKRDNIPLRVCDYYLNTGDISSPEPTGEDDPEKTSTITYMVTNADGELEPGSEMPKLVIGTTYYFSVAFSNDDDESTGQWRITYSDQDDENRLAYEKLMVIRNVNDTTISLRPGKSNKIKGKTFTLAVCDANGNYESSITVEVAE